MIEPSLETTDKREEKPWLVANAIMIDAGFTYELMWRSQVWAAKPYDCPKCMVPAGYPCHNMTDVRKGIPYIRSNKFPHPERVNWQLLVNTLRLKGYR